MREALLSGASGVSSLFDEVAKNAVVNVFSGIAVTRVSLRAISAISCGFIGRMRHVPVAMCRVAVWG